MTPPSEPRLAPLPFAEWDDDARAVLLPHLRRPELYLSGAADAPPMPVVLELFAQHLPLSGAWLPFTACSRAMTRRSSRSTESSLILRVAWRTHSGYEWTQHVRSGRETGLTDGADRCHRPRRRLRTVWTPLERALLRAVDEMIDGFAVGEETWGTLAASFDGAQMLELLFVIGGYVCLAFVLNSVGLQPDLPTGSGPWSPG